MQDVLAGGWGALGAIDDLAAVYGDEARRGYGQAVEIAMDAVADEAVVGVVASPMFAADHATSHRRVKFGATYRIVSGSAVAHLREDVFAIKAEDGDTRVMTLQVADGTQPLASA